MRRGVGELTRLRTWDLVDRLLPPSGRVLDVGGGPGTHAAYLAFHRPEELRGELADAGFGDIGLLAVEGYAWLLGDLEERMADPGPLLRAVRLSESEPTMLGCSAHVIGAGTRP